MFTFEGSGLIHKSENPLFKQFKKLDIIGSDVWLAGGALRHLFMPLDPISDFDIFFRNISEAVPVEKYLVEQAFKVVFKCPIGKLTTLKKDDMKVQLITENQYASPEDLMNHFDIKACRFAYDGNKIYTYYSSIRDVKNKKVNLHDVDFPSATFRRILKYQDKGYKVTNKTIEFMIARIYDAGKNKEDLDRRFYID